MSKYTLFKKKNVHNYKYLFKNRVAKHLPEFFFFKPAASVSVSAVLSGAGSSPYWKSLADRQQDAARGSTTAP